MILRVLGNIPRYRKFLIDNLKVLENQQKGVQGTGPRVAICNGFNFSLFLINNFLSIK